MSTAPARPGQRNSETRDLNSAQALVAGGIFYGLVYLLGFEKIDNTSKLDAKTLFDLVKLSLGVVAGAGALVALVVAYRRQRVDEVGAHREAIRLHTERFSQAVEQLGSDSLNRLAATLGVPTLTDLGYQNAGPGFRHPVKKPKGGELAEPDKAFNAVIRGVRAVPERANALLKVTFEALRRVSLDPADITRIARAALVLLQLEHGRTA
ncbi:transposase family protein [Streptomyces sp. NPDC058440]|uniref:transposase family protein n=1 Tax=Streptomyces sp. NPDC058440 TaxID=3346501 RepID=UPI00366409A2